MNESTIRAANKFLGVSENWLSDARVPFSHQIGMPSEMRGDHRKPKYISIKGAKLTYAEAAKKLGVTCQKITSYITMYGETETVERLIEESEE